MFSEFQPKSASWPSRFYSHSFVTNLARLLWVVFVIYGELGTFFLSLVNCRWPSVNSGHKKAETTRVLLLADAQVQRPSPPEKTSWLTNIRRTMFELNLRKSWHVTSRLKPDVVVFLGDMLSNGRSAQTQKEYEQGVQKFKTIFSVDQDTPVYFLPGNNDVGLGSVHTVSRRLRSFYKQSFGLLNQEFKIANHTFILLDAPGLVDEDYQRHAKYVTYEDWKPIPQGPVAFVKEAAEYDPSNVVLLSHIPLSRSETGSCGPNRERSALRRNAGIGYQSMLGKQTTNFLFKNLQPMVVFSADNRDYCEYKHVLPGTKGDPSSEETSIREVTVKSFSTSVHIKRPGFQLLSLVDANLVSKPDHSSYADRLCLLPDQYAIYTSFYGPCLIFTFILLFFLNFRGMRLRRSKRADHLTFTPSPRSSGRNSPNLLQVDRAPWSAALWSPFTPGQRPNSPRAALPSHLRTPRTPSGATAKFVASHPAGSSGPSSPSLAIPSIFNADSLEEDQEDHLYPHQYAHAIRRDSYTREDDDWSNLGSQGQDDEFDENRLEEGGQVIEMKDPEAHSPRVQSQYISAPTPGWKQGTSRWSWSYTFVFRGRRRRISLGIPSWGSLYNLLDLFGFNEQPKGGVGGLTLNLPLRKRRGGMGSLVLDCASVLWPASVVYLIINWTIL